MNLHFLVETSVLNNLLVHSFPKCFPGQSFEHLWPTTERDNLVACFIHYIKPNSIENLEQQYTNLILSFMFPSWVNVFISECTCPVQHFGSVGAQLCLEVSTSVIYYLLSGIVSVGSISELKIGGNGDQSCEIWLCCLSEIHPVVKMRGTMSMNHLHPAAIQIWGQKGEFKHFPAGFC